MGGDWSNVAGWFKELYGPHIKDEFSKITINKSVEVNDGQSQVHIVRGMVNEDTGKVEGVTFILEDVSRVLTHQLVRHRLYASYSQRSQRYTKVKEGEFIYPPLDYIKLKTIRKQLKRQFESAYSNSIKAYNKVVNEGIEHNGEIFKVRKEDARFVIPNGSKTTIMVTMIGDGLYNFLRERTHEHAQWEIREVARVIDEFVKGKVE